LLQRAGKERLNSPERPARTLVSEDVRNRSDLPPSKYLVFPVRKTERSLIERFFSLGQTRNNDIVVRDVSVSKSHAFFQEDGQGGFTLLDARSTNGTFINGERVPRHGQGEPVRVRSGDQLRFGNVELSFVEAQALVDEGTGRPTLFRDAPGEDDPLFMLQNGADVWYTFTTLADGMPGNAIRIIPGAIDGFLAPVGQPDSSVEVPIAQRQGDASLSRTPVDLATGGLYVGNEFTIAGRVTSWSRSKHSDSRFVSF